MEHVHKNKHNMLGFDGNIYKWNVDENKWISIFQFEEWEIHVKSNYLGFRSGLITLDDLTEQISNIDEFKKISKFEGEICYHLFGSCQYHSIYKMYFLLQTLKFYNLDISIILDYNIDEFITNKQNQKNLINMIKVNKLDYISYRLEDIIYYGYTSGLIIENVDEYMNNIEEGADDKRDYFWCPCPEDKISKEHLAILNEKWNEYMEDGKNKIRAKFTFTNEEHFNEIIERLFNKDDREVKYKFKHIDMSEEFLNTPYVRPEFDENQIMWNDDDLVICSSGVKMFHVPLECVSEERRVKHNMKCLEFVKENINSLRLLNSFAEYDWDPNSKTWNEVEKLFLG